MVETSMRLVETVRDCGGDYIMRDWWRPKRQHDTAWVSERLANICRDSKSSALTSNNNYRTCQVTEPQTQLHVGVAMGVAYSTPSIGNPVCPISYPMLYTLPTNT